MNLTTFISKVQEFYGEQAIVVEDKNGEVTISTGFEVDADGNLVKMSGLWPMNIDKIYARAVDNGEVILEEGDGGELVIYTGLKYDENGETIPLDFGDDWE